MFSSFEPKIRRNLIIKINGIGSSVKKILLLAFVSFATAQETKESPVSEAFGHLIYHNFQRLNMEFDIEKIVQGILDAADGKEPPMDVNQCIDKIYSDYKIRHKIQSENNLRQAEAFLKSNAQRDGVVSLNNQKVQYKIISPGKGPEIAPNSSPRLRCKIKTLDGEEIFGTVRALVEGELTESTLEETVNLDAMIEGLRIGLLGMKEGEKRIIYVHPDLSFKTKQFYFNLPNTLFVFEIEAIKV
jgi:peptidylprolyl isomerase